jgi:hypothetical protein
MSPKFRFLLPAVAATMVTVIAGCSDAGSPTGSAPRAAPLGAHLASAADLDQIAQFKVKPQITIAWAKKWIGPEGGTLDFQGFTIVVPAGAVDRVTMFSIKLPVDPNGSNRVVAEFGPHGAQFAAPLTIAFPYRGTTIEGASGSHVVWWNNGWVDMGGTVSADGSQLVTTTTHFSEYGTTAQRGGLILSGG